MIKIARQYVFVVLEHDTQQATLDKKGNPKLKGKSAILHGVYINKSEAVGKGLSVLAANSGKDIGYLCILKKPLHGKNVKEAL